MIIQQVKKKAEDFFVSLGDFTVFVLKVGNSIRSRKVKLKLVIDHMVYLGINSLSITLITAMFVGMSFSVQIVREFLRFGAGDLVGGIVGLAVWRELGPMMTGAVVAGKIGAAISAEIGTMKVTEQVEALESMSQDAVSYLVTPRVIALTLMMPLLVGMADIVGFLSGFGVATLSKINPVGFFHSAQVMLTVQDIMGGLVKALFFGFTIAMTSTYYGLQAKAGAKGVGDVTKKAVVVSLISVFVLNYFFSLFIFK